VKLDQFKEQIEREIKEIKKLPPDSKVSLRLKQLDVAVADVDKRLKSIETVIVQSPSRALELPMLRKDLEVYKESYQASNLALKGEIERFYDFYKWFLGLMLTMFLSILGLAVTNFMKVKSSDNKN
jgi:paraquat-inducible protein B